MRIYNFMLRLGAEPNLDTVDRLYGYFGKNGTAPEGVLDVTLCVLAGKPIADCTVKATSFESALEMVLPKLRDEDLHIVSVEVDEAGLAVLTNTL